MSFLTDARRAVWDAIEAEPSLSSIKSRLKFEDKPGGFAGASDLAAPTIGDLPRLEIWPVGANSNWVLNTSQRILYPLEIRLWTADWQVLQAETYWESILKAVWQGLQPERRIHSFTAMQGQPINLGGGNVATRWAFQLVIDAGFWNPKTQV